MKKLLMAIVAMMLWCVLADTWMDPETGIIWSYSVKNGEAWIGDGTVSGEHAIPLDTAGDIVVPAIVSNYHVAAISDFAFHSCKLITSVRISEGIRTIGDGAFIGCAKVGVFEIPASITNITFSYEGNPFTECVALSNIVIASGNQYYKVIDGMLLNRDGTHLLKVPSRSDTFSIPDTVTVIGTGAFDRCAKLHDISLQAPVAEIESYAFTACASLQSVTLSSTVTNVGRFAFNWCQNLRTIIFNGDNPLNETFGWSISRDAVFKVAPGSIGWGVDIPGIWNGHEITYIEGHTPTKFPDGQYEVETNGCLWSFIIKDGLAVVGSGSYRARAVPISTGGVVTIPSVLGNCPVVGINDYAFWECKEMTGLMIPEGVECIGSYAIYECDKLETITIPSSVTSIGWEAFYGCSGLTSVTIPSSLTSLGDFAFSGCRGLTRFVVDAANPIYLSANGLLLSKDGKTLVAGVNGDVAIPSSVTSIGQGAFCGCSGLTSVKIPSSVTSIGDWVFESCCGLTQFIVEDNNPNYLSANDLLLSKDGKTLIAGINGDVAIPQSVTNIGHAAFFGCGGLKSVMIPSSVTSIGESAFDRCSGLTNVTLSSGMKSIGDGAFARCVGLTSVAIPDGVESIGADAFYRCSELASVTIPLSVISIGAHAFSGCEGLGNGMIIVDGCVLGVNGECPASVILPIGTRIIAGGAFCDCVGLTSVTIPDSVTSIGDWAFEGCSGLMSLTIPSSVTRIAGGAFSGCSGLTDVTIPSSVTSIGDWAFECCYGLTSMTIPEGVMSIGYRAFAGCSGLTSVTIPSSVMSIGENAFCDCSRLGDGVVIVGDCVLCVNGKCPSDVVLPIGTRIIVGGAFEGCIGLTNVTIPPSVTSIGNATFMGCSGLTSVTIPSSVTSIGEGAFCGCSGLTDVTIPSSVTSIGDRTFSWCNSLTNIVFEGDAPVEVGYNAFYDVCSGCTATVFEGTKGWDYDGDGMWQGLKLVYRPNPIPILSWTATREDVATALNGSADEKLVENITNATSYAAYRAWAQEVNGTNGTSVAGVEAVKAAKTAWVSFALGSDKLLVEEPKDENLTVEQFKPTSAAGKFDFTVKVGGVNVGSEADKENLKQVLGLEGAATLDSTAFSSDNVDITFGAPVDGKVKFTAGPKTTTDTFFMKVKVK